jgi:TRAP-type C4-dicarboxylate transport system substrate-binding protein
MFKALARCVLFAFAVMPCAAFAEPVTLKLAFISSDRSTSYLAAVKPFVDAVNAEAKGLIEIKVHFSGALGNDLTQQAQLVLDGTADIAYVVTGLTRDRFADNAIMEMPGLFRNMRESTVVFTRLVAAKALRGYDDYFVIGAYVTEPETIHSKTPIASLGDLKGKRMRVNNPGEAAALEKFGALPILMSVTKISEAISSGSLDGAVVSPSPLNDYGIKRVASYHYLLGISGAPLMVLMNQKKFDALPKSAQAIIVKYSGEWAAKRFIDTYEAVENSILEELKSDPKRTIIFPSTSDVDRAQIAFNAVIADWLAKNPYHQKLFKQTEYELASLRAVR